MGLLKVRPSRDRNSDSEDEDLGGEGSHRKLAGRESAAAKKRTTIRTGARAKGQEKMAPRAAKHSAWKVSNPPESYGSVDDESLCRLVRVRHGASLTDIKKAILAAYEHQYRPDEITLFTDEESDEPTPVTTDRDAANRLLSYQVCALHVVCRVWPLRVACQVFVVRYIQPDWEAVVQGDPEPGCVLLVVSPYNDPTEARLLVLPAAHSPPTAQ